MMIVIVHTYTEKIVKFLGAPAGILAAIMKMYVQIHLKMSTA